MINMTTSFRGAGGKIIIISTMWSDKDKKDENVEDEDNHDLGYDKHKFKKSSKLVKNIMSVNHQQQNTSKNSRFVYEMYLTYLKILCFRNNPLNVFS